MTSERVCGNHPSDRSPGTALHQTGAGVAVHIRTGDDCARTMPEPSTRANSGRHGHLFPSGFMSCSPDSVTPAEASRLDPSRRLSLRQGDCQGVPARRVHGDVRSRAHCGVPTMSARLTEEAEEDTATWARARF